MPDEVTPLRWLVKDGVGTLQMRVGYEWEDVPVEHEVISHIAQKSRDRYVDSTLTQKELARQQGFTGDVCVQCGGARMRRNGPCLVCEQCGQTTGCS